MSPDEALRVLLERLRAHGHSFRDAPGGSESELMDLIGARLGKNTAFVLIARDELCTRVLANCPAQLAAMLMGMGHGIIAAAEDGAVGEEPQQVSGRC